MKTTNEILVTWDTEGFYSDWYAIDSYDPITHEQNRLFVGELDDVVTTMTNYYTTPAMTSDSRFYRSSIISSDEALEYFQGLVKEGPASKDSEFLRKAVEIVARKRDLYEDFSKEGKTDLAGEYLSAWWHTSMMLEEITGLSHSEVDSLVSEVLKCSRTPF